MKKEKIHNDFKTEIVPKVSLPTIKVENILNTALDLYSINKEFLHTRDPLAVKAKEFIIQAATILGYNPSSLSRILSIERTLVYHACSNFEKFIQSDLTYRKEYKKWLDVLYKNDFEQLISHDVFKYYFAVPKGSGNYTPSLPASQVIISVLRKRSKVSHLDMYKKVGTLHPAARSVVYNCLIRLKNTKVITYDKHYYSMNVD